MTYSKKTFVAISMSIVLSTYLYSGTSYTCNKDGDDWIVENANADGNNSLSACVLYAGNDGVDSKVVFDGDYTIGLTNEIDIEDDGSMTIDGGSNNIVIYGTTDVRIFNIINPSKTTLQNLTLENGDQNYGGAIDIYEADVEIKNCTLTENGASSRGGAIYSYNSNLSITDSTISGNSAGSGGGAVYSYNTNLSITDSTISGNSADDDGGGIFISNYDGENVETTINNSTISGNTASDDGGGIFIYHYYGGNTLTTINNSTISGNTASDYGGGIATYDDHSGIMVTTINNSTISGNGAVNVGGGISNDDSNISIKNTIIYGNNSINNSDTNDSDEITSLGYNLVGTINTFNNSNSTDIVGQDPLLEPLADNGGPTKTHALQKASPAIDAGYSDIPLDQRGEQRDNSPDIGSYEYQGGGVNPSIIMYLLN